MLQGPPEINRNPPFQYLQLNSSCTAIYHCLYASAAVTKSRLLTSTLFFLGINSPVTCEVTVADMKM